MNDQLTNNPDALRLFFTEDVYLISREENLSNHPDDFNELETARLINPLAAEDTFEDNPQAVLGKEPEVVLVEEIDIMGVEVILAKEPVTSIEIITAKETIALKKPEVLSEELPKQDVSIISLESENDQALKQDPITPVIDFKYMGNNQKKVLILVNDPGYEVSTELGRDILRNLVTAMNLKTNDFALVNYAHYAGSTFADLKDFFSSKVMLVFGIEPSQLGLPVYPKNIKVLHLDTTLIFTANLNELNNDLPGKKILWTNLQQLAI
jgi:hypothetical protein